MNAIEAIERTQLVERPDMRSGDTVRVHVRVREGDKERVQVFEGIVIGIRRGSARASVRRAGAGGAPQHGTARRRTWAAAIPATERPQLPDTAQGRARGAPAGGPGPLRGYACGQWLWA